MAMQAYLSIEGRVQTELTKGASSAASVGNTYQGAHENEIMLYAFSHQMMSTRNPQTGQPTGGRIHKPIVITKAFDRTSPLLLEALHNGERMEKFKIEWYRQSAEGRREHYYSTELEEAVIVEIKDYMDLCHNSETMNPLHLEEVHIAYRKITVTHHKASTSGVSNWDDKTPAA